MATPSSESRKSDNMLPQFRLKGCPRCGGDLRRGRDYWGPVDTCVQCSHVFDICPIQEDREAPEGWRFNKPVLTDLDDEDGDEDEEGSIGIVAEHYSKMQYR